MFRGNVNKNKADGRKPPANQPVVSFGTMRGCGRLNSENASRAGSEKGVYFTSVAAFRKAITPKRLELLNAIKKGKPSSVRQLSKIAERDVKNVSMDVKFLEQAGKGNHTICKL